MVLRHLNYLITDTRFFNGVKKYLTDFGFKNATIDDFITSMSAYFIPSPAIAGYTIQNWRDTWLLTPSLNVLVPSWDPTITSGNADLTITQLPYDNKYPTLRYHKIIVTYVKTNGTYNNQSVLVNNVTETKVTYNAANNYKAIILNSNMNGFVRCHVDQTSLDFLTTNISKITGGGAAASGLIRMCAWHNMNEMVRDSLIKAADYKNIILSNIAA